MSDTIERLSDINQSELEILRKVNELGAALEEEIAIKLNRLDDDLKPELDRLRERKLLQVRPAEHGDEGTNIYLTDRSIRKLL